MVTSDFDYNLPSILIAQFPPEKRDQSRLMVVEKQNKIVHHQRFSDIINFLRPGDLVVWNNSKVFKARLKGEIEFFPLLKHDDKANKQVLNLKPVEIFLVRPMENRGVWKVLAKPARRLRLGMKVRFAPDFFCEVILKENEGSILVQFDDDDAVVRAKANRYGEVPTPPYITPPPETNQQLSERYQTVYAKTEGSVAAPTAGFHFTPELIEDLKRKGIDFAEVTLHVGLGTFLPVKVENLSEHKMHEEWVELTDKNASLINEAKKEKRRVVAVGTTTVRTLEGIAAFTGTPLKAYSGNINIFITPGFKFQIIDALITNFHLPKSTLLMLVSAFIGDNDFTLQCYREAIENKYRFYSFGDAMFIE